MEIRTELDLHTWNNRRKGFYNVGGTLDKKNFKGDLSDFNSKLKPTVLPWSGSDHYSVLLEILGEAKTSGHPFKFELMWFNHEEFLPNIKKWWNEGVFVGSKLYYLVSKLKDIKHKFLDWNKKKFKKIVDEKIRIEKELELVNKDFMQHGMTQTTYEVEKKLLCEYEDILARDEIFWKQKSRETWLEDRDRNTKFSHHSVKLKKSKKQNNSDHHR